MKRLLSQSILAGHHAIIRVDNHSCRIMQHSSLVIGPAPPLSPAIRDMKSLADQALANMGGSDLVLHNHKSETESTALGEQQAVTDIAFENRDSKTGAKKNVSFYFRTSTKKGVTEYRKLAAVVKDLPNVELSFTPHFGQSRISFPWDEFWSLVNNQQLSLFDPESAASSFPLLEGSSSAGTTESETEIETETERFRPTDTSSIGKM